MSKESNKTKNNSDTTKIIGKTKNNSLNKSLIPEKYQNPLLVILLGLLLIVFFHSAIFSGSFWGANDTISGVSFYSYLEQSEEFPLWQPYIFSGQPGFAAMMEPAIRNWDITFCVLYYSGQVLKTIFGSDTMRILLWYIVMAAGMYYLMRLHNQKRIVSFFVAAAFVLGTGVSIWIMIGHHAKPATIAALPFIFIMMERIKEKVSLLNIVLLTIVMHFLLAGWHVQMVFYVACAVSFYLILDFITQIVKKGNWQGVLKLVGVFVIATIIAVVMSADRYLSVLEYNTYSTRGSSPITSRIEGQDNDANTSKKSKEDYDYATMWSFSPNEIIDLFVPSYHGFGKVTYSGPLTGGQETRIMTYWGQKPFEDATPYMGAVVMFLALLGIIRYFKRNTFVQAMTFTMVFGLFLSFGYTLPILFDMFFFYFPKFSSFRAPSMSLILMHFTIPILAAFGLQAISEMREKYDNYKKIEKKERMAVNIFMGAIIAFVIIGFIFAGGFESSYITSVTHSKALQGYGEQTLTALAPFIYDNVISDWTVIGLLCFLLVGLTYFYINGKMSNNLFLVSVTLIMLIDIWRVSDRAIEVVDKSVEENPFPKTDIIEFIQNDERQTGERFRVCDMSAQIVNSDAYYFIENINGYHPAKLRTFQDMMDVMCKGSTSTVMHPFLWNLMNAKYVITTQKLSGDSEPYFQSQQTGAYVYYNPTYCKRVFFVDSVKVADDYSILKLMNSNKFNPKTIAYLEKKLPTEIIPSRAYDAEMREIAKMMQQQDTTIQFEDSIVNSNSDFVPTSKIVDYKNEYIKIETETKATHLLVLSEMYFPDWHAYIDGKETEIYKTDFAFRSVVVPAGKHTIEFKFISPQFNLGRNLSAASNIIVLLALVLGIILEQRKNKKK